MVVEFEPAERDPVFNAAPGIDPLLLAPNTHTRVEKPVDAHVGGIADRSEDVVVRDCCLQDRQME